MQPSIRTVGVVGTGVIGASWTALFLSRGLRVLVTDPAPGAEDRLFAYLRESWPILEGLGLHKEASISNCTFVSGGLDCLSEVDFVQEVRICLIMIHLFLSQNCIQNAPEKPDLKQNLFAELDYKVKKDIVIASSSSGIPSSQFISKCKHPERILIGHPFNPPHLVLQCV
jgi:3-hydroxyacyl-CoA dehydrogenase